MNVDTEECEVDDSDECPEGSTMNVDTEECEVDDSDECPEGSTMNVDTEECEVDETDETDTTTDTTDDTAPLTCPGESSPMTVDTNADGTIDDKDCVAKVEAVTVIGPTTPSSVEEITPLVLGVELVAAPAAIQETGAVLGAELTRPEAVLGVQVERGAVAPAALARTGAGSSNGVLVLLAAFLLALGTALVRVGGRRPQAI